MNIQASDPVSGRSVTIDASIGENLNEAVALVGGEIVYNNYKHAAVISAQAAIRRRIKKGETDDVIQTALKDWKPGLQTIRTTDPVEAIKKRMEKLSPEDKRKALEKLLADLGD